LAVDAARKAFHICISRSRARGSFLIAKAGMDGISWATGEKRSRELLQ
jgi:hypothetical protein